MKRQLTSDCDPESQEPSKRVHYDETLPTLPQEIAELLLSYAAQHEWVKLSLVCKAWGEIMKNQPQWEEAVKKTKEIAEITRMARHYEAMEKREEEERKSSAFLKKPTKKAKKESVQSHDYLNKVGTCSRCGDERVFSNLRAHQRSASCQQRAEKLDREQQLREINEELC
eukprot:TRINITY_DN16007_c0_g1_i1.p1 TRINITY_DN16007_c0_g1~~TRINITY_DN16007_c0_g1_i1.p1  ORF type:complete len:170 (+),score=39.81 TRINITY_DN16007_c0_g1_i1:66-575(+)